MSEQTPTEPTPTIKVVHLWASMISVIVGMFISAGLVVWSIAVFKTDTTNALATVGRQIGELKEEIGAVSADARDSRDWIMRREGAEAESQRRSTRPPGDPRYYDDGLPKFRRP